MSNENVHLCAQRTDNPRLNGDKKVIFTILGHNQVFIRSEMYRCLFCEASNDDMKKAYRKSVLKEHPDKGGTNEGFRKIQEAWDYFRKFCKF